ncbi:hypothetical protein [Brevundimonas sp. ZS04]|uniref:hypothetical protein n=1 Tax=Brevundimonas sp. ZS04 TaxID=1906854 RepID=UPI00096BEC0B|nr:hypothetical protein [Brevundimonas sp. ZS04]OMG58399.1 hypothetical protein BJP32_09675 [Brevundimonas sp. ZS04]
MTRIDHQKRRPAANSEMSEASPAYDSRHPVLHRVVLSPAGGLIRIAAFRAAVPTTPNTDKAAPSGEPHPRKT